VRTIFTRTRRTPTCIDKLETQIQLLEEEQALAESEQIFKWVFEQGPLGMTMTAPDYRFVKVNSTFCQMLGFSEPELTSMKFTEITYPEDLEGSVTTAERLFSGKMSFHCGLASPVAPSLIRMVILYMPWA
jgi:PAS domain-containing protein